MPQNYEHSCEDIIAKLDLILDGALLPDEEKRVLQEIEECSHCLEKYNVAKSFKEFLAKKIQKKKIPPHLVELIRQKIGSRVSE